MKTQEAGKGGGVKKKKKQLLSERFGLKRRHPYPTGGLPCPFPRYRNLIDLVYRVWYWKHVGFLPGCQTLFRFLLWAGAGKKA